MYLDTLGKDEAGLIENALRAGQELPEKIKNAPDLWMGNHFYYAAYMQLSSDRAGMELGPIRFSAIERFADLHSLSYEERVDLHDILASVDNQYLAHINAKREKKRKIGDGPTGKKPVRSKAGGRSRPR